MLVTRCLNLLPTHCILFYFVVKKKIQKYPHKGYSCLLLRYFYGSLQFFSLHKNCIHFWFISIAFYYLGVGNFHLNPPAVLYVFTHLQQFIIWLRIFFHKNFEASVGEIKDLINTQSLVYWFTGLLLARMPFCFHSFEANQTQSTLNWWILFSDAVHHSRFFTLLSFLIPFLWFT